MITGYPTPLATWDEPRVIMPRARPTSVVANGSWHYDPRQVSRYSIAIAAAISAALHASVIFGALLLPKKAAPVIRVVETPVIRLVIPELKELEEPEVSATNDDPPPIDLSVPVPMQADLPALAKPDSFVQPLNFASLLERPDLSNASLTVIPENYVRGARLAERIGKIFNLDDLDRHPVPTLQPSPTYPISMRREGLSSIVIVQFVVDAEGRVVEPVVVESSHSAFNDAAITGVARWKFRPGIRGGRKVNVRMQVPINFKVLDIE
jgi:periplasmic protein TonB